METINVYDVAGISATASGGEALLKKMKEIYFANKQATIYFDDRCNMSSSFLNGSIIAFLEDYGFENLKKNFRVKGSKVAVQFIKKQVYKAAELEVK